MTRPLRIEYEGAWYHVMNRGAGRRVIYPTDQACEVFLETVGEAVRRFHLEVHGYCLMANHYHLLVRTPLGNLSRAMRHIDGIYTQRHNRLMDTDGPLLRGRYKAIVIDADAYLLTVSRYIHRNPVETEPPLVARLKDWPWSSYPAYIGSREPLDWLHREAVYRMLGRKQHQRGYRLFVEAGVDEEIAEFYGRGRRPPVLGDETFRERVMIDARDTTEVAHHERRLLQEPEAILEAVARHYGLPVEAMLRRGRLDRLASQARSIAMGLCQARAGLTLNEIGERFGGIGYSTVAQRIRRLRASVGEEELERLGTYIMCRLDP